jgi:hypothetical protein
MGLGLGVERSVDDPQSVYSATDLREAYMASKFGSRGCWQRELRLAAAFALVTVGLCICATSSRAGDSSAKAPTDMSGGSLPTVLAQTNSPSQPEKGWFSDFHLSGFLNETAGMWINPSTLKDFTPSRNNLATTRAWVQVDESYHIGANNEFFTREWFIYEPPYSFNSANNQVFPCTNLPVFPCGNTSGAAMNRLNGFYNQYNVRDAWWKLTTGPLTLYTGNQIVVWGQSLAFRVGDVINPQDTTWNFGFANLEQSRIPQWMIHPIFNLPDLGPLSSNFLEGVLIPGVQPVWTSWRYPDGRFDNSQGNAGRVDAGFPAAMHGPSARFDVHYPYFVPRVNIQTLPAGINPNFVAEPGAANIIPSPFDRFVYMCSQLQGVFFGPGSVNKNPTPKRLIRPCQLNGVNIAPYHVPAVTLGNMQEGLRFHTLIGSSEVTALYYNTFQRDPIIAWSPYTQTFPFEYEPVQYAGVTLDRPITLPGSLAESLPLVGRAEAVYQNHAPFISFDLSQTQSFRYSDIMTWMVALDLSSAYAPWMTSTGTVSANLEVLDPIVMDATNSMAPGPNGTTIPEPVTKNDVQMLFNLNTSWWWNAIAPNWTMIYQVKGTTFALFPSIQLTPPWTNKYFAKIGLIYVLGSDRQALGVGLFKGENLITFTGQYNFNVM